MNVCGKALPPKAASLLGTNILLMVIAVPLMLSLHSSSSGMPTVQFTDTIIRLMIIGLFCQAVFYYAELYNLQIARRSREQIWRMLGAVGLVMLVLAIIFWAAPDLSPGRDALLGLPLTSMAVLLFTRSISTPARLAKVALVGPDPVAPQSAQIYPNSRVEPGSRGQFPVKRTFAASHRLTTCIVSLFRQMPGSKGGARHSDKSENARCSRGERRAIL